VPPFSATLRHRAKQLFLHTVSALTNRAAVLLPADAADVRRLAATTPYRVAGGTAIVEVSEPASGRLQAALHRHEGITPADVIWSAEREYTGGCRLQFDTSTGAVSIDGVATGAVQAALEGRRFSWHLRLVSADGVRTRWITQYMSDAAVTVDRDYFHGLDYTDYELQSQAEPALILGLMEQYGGVGPVLDVGCATGLVLQALRERGFDAVGCDVSEWAVSRARQRLGRDAAYVCDFEADGVPDLLRRRAPFGTLVLWAVLEHFRDPLAVLEKLDGLVRPDTLLLINTSNADSLSHTIFGDDWEGYFDRTHHGVSRVSAGMLKQALPRLGWRLLSLRTHGVWDGSMDPTRATLREWYSTDGRFRQLLTERDLGDLLICAAVKT
jgi:SAM-dependent methyltransferase